MIIGYTRVSTKGQIDNNSFEQQEKEIKERYNNAKIYKEQFTGTTTHRPILEMRNGQPFSVPRSWNGQAL